MSGSGPRVRRGLSIVTVVYRGEIALLRLQARSLARFMAPDDVTEILIVINDIDEDVCVEMVRGMLSDYGRFADRVEIIRPAMLFGARPDALGPKGIRNRLAHWVTAHRTRYALGVKGGWAGNRGWSVQQAFKLLVSRRASGDILLILDAKNHLVRAVGSADFVADDGRARSYLRRASDKQWTWIEGSFAHMGVRVPDRDTPVPPTVTPFCVERGLARECVDALEARLGPAETFFARKGGLLRTFGRRKRIGSEFSYIFAHAVAARADWTAAWAPGLKPPATIHRRSDDTATHAALQSVEQGQADFLAVHASRVGSLSPDVRHRLAAIWASRGLDASELLATMPPAGQQPAQTAAGPVNSGRGIKRPHLDAL